MRVVHRLLFPVVLLAAFAAAAACGDDSAPESSGSGIKVVATTTQIGALVRAVAGDNVQLTVLLPAGADAHDYEPNPQAVKKLNDADVILRNGIGLDDWLDATIEGAGGDARLITVTDGVAVSEGEDGEPDPHVWHDARNVQVMVSNIAAALAEADPANAAAFQGSAEAYRQRLSDVDREIRALIAAVPEANRKMVTNHDAFGYFIRAYGLEFVGAVIPSTSKDAQADAKALAALQELIKDEGVKAIFAEEEVDPKVARELARDTGVKIVEGLYADSLGEKGSGADTIDGMLLSNARKISEALR